MDRRSERAPVPFRELGIVALGGGAGALTRYLLSLGIGDPSAFPVAVFAINLTGAFALGLLLEFLSRLGDDTGGRRRVRLLVGTGVLGGYTTYSSLAEGAANLLLEGTASAVLVAATYGVGTVVLGGLMSWLGILAGRRFGRRSPSAEPSAHAPVLDAPPKTSPSAGGPSSGAAR